jgi:Fe-S cluster assembly protein SufD
MGAGADRAVSALLESLQAGFEALPAARREARGLGAMRREALRSALADGLPGQRSERWKYTPLRALSARRFLAVAPAPEVPAALLQDVPAPRLVFVNGALSPELSRLDDLPAGLSVAALSAVLDSPEAGAAEAAFAPAFERADEVFARLNSAFATEGALVRVAAGARIDTPLQLVFVGAPVGDELATHLRHRIELGAGASLALVEQHLSTAAHRNLDNHLLQLELGEGAALLHARVQDAADGATLLARTDARLAAEAAYRRVDLELGASLSRHELNVALEGKGARFDSGGALLASGRRHVDTRLGVRHVAGDTTCELLWRGLAAERGKLSFHGGIEILVGADGSDASLSNKNLLLSPHAEIDTQPVLQIHADEVKAAHGATVGRLDPLPLFYLRARGIPLAQARVLLTLAFCREVLAFAGAPALVEALSPRLEARLAALETLA